ncbi:uncharacterized protein LOC130135554 [Syzygium oleosum]|uniref:uncharacterized protein LOC130135554 n=1 Tax=Syzygium oleosum TaxID=219896 RepID=UPI0024B902F1|nr:uncharacterized protein LOC130135554 [Syzygium oleosum]
MGEFQRLYQNQLSVDQYEAKFAELFRYAPRLIKDPVDRARRFRDGLKSKIKDQLVPLNLKDFNELYERAHLIKRNLAEQAAASRSRFAFNRDNRRFRKRPMTGGRHSIPPNMDGVGKSAYNSNGRCRFCGRKHGTAPCPSKIGACFECGQQGHIARNYPRRQSRTQPQQLQMGQPAGNAPQNNLNRPQAQGRVYAIARKEAKDSLNVVTSTVSLRDHAAYALFDLRASHPFISEQFVKLVELKPKPLKVILSVTTPLKDEVLVSVGCPGNKIIVGGREEVIDLAILAMYDFDVIIEMDWLVKQRAVVDCCNRIIQFNPIGHSRYEFVGDRGGTSIPLILSLQVTRLLDEGCQGYLETVVNSLVEELRMEDIAECMIFPMSFLRNCMGYPQKGK